MQAGWLSFLLARVVMGLHIQSVLVPKYAKIGDSPSLICDYNIENDRLYSVKWYKDNMEFYRYLPNDSPQKQDFQVTGVRVVLSKSDEMTVQLQTVNLVSSGTYMCEVSSEAPRFKTVEARADLTVIQPPNSPPVLSQPLGSGRGDRYRVGDMFEVNCSSPGSSPPAKLRYFINNMMEDGSHTVAHRRVDSDGLISPSLTLSFRLTREHFQEGVLRIRCEARIYNMWDETTNAIYPGESLGEKALERILAGGTSPTPGHLDFFSIFVMIALLL